MSQFEDRERAEEKKFELDQQVEFKAAARRNKLLGLWAGELLGLTGPEAEAYAQSVVAADLTSAGEEDVFAKLRADFNAKGVAVSDHLIRAHMAELLTKARAQIEAGS